MPNSTDKVLQGAGSRGVVGTELSESLPNIKSSFAMRAGTDAPDAWINTGYSRGGTTPAVPTLDAAASSVILSISADKSSSTYQDNAPVQQDALCIVYAVKY